MALLLNVEVDRVDAVDRPANGFRFLLLKSADGRAIEVALRVVKADSTQKYSLGVVYAPNQLDAQGDSMRAHDIETAAWRYLRAGAKVGLMHQAGTEGAGGVVESYIYRGPRWELNGQVIEPGSWLLGVVWNEPTWAQIKSGKLSGLSLQGWGAVKRAGSDAPDDSPAEEPPPSMQRFSPPDPAELTPALREAIDAAVRSALRQALPRLADELEKRFRGDVAELRRSLGGHLSHSRKPFIL